MSMYKLKGIGLAKSKPKSRPKSVYKLKGIFLYTVGVLFYAEWCIRQLYNSTTILYNIASIAHNHHTSILIPTLF